LRVNENNDRQLGNEEAGHALALRAPRIVVDLEGDVLVDKVHLARQLRRIRGNATDAADEIDDRRFPTRTPRISSSLLGMGKVVDLGMAERD
jgi:hypothetical protein